MHIGEVASNFVSKFNSAVLLITLHLSTYNWTTGLLEQETMHHGQFISSRIKRCSALCICADTLTEVQQ